MRYSTSIDWSGDDGDPRKAGSSRWLVFAAVHINVDDHDEVSSALERTRYSRRLPDTFAFKFHSSRSTIRDAFFREIGATRFRATILVVDKRNWRPEWIRQTRGPVRIAEMVADLLEHSPDECVAEQRVYIDYPAHEGAIVRLIRKKVRDQLMLSGKIPPKSMRPLADDRSDGFTIQMADMIAGLIHAEVEGERTDFGHPIRGQLVIVKR